MNFTNFLKTSIFIQHLLWLLLIIFRILNNIQKIIYQKQPSTCVFSKRCSKNMEKTYRGTSMPKCDFNKVASQLYIKITLRRGFFPVNLLHIFRILFLKNTLGGLLLNQYCFILCLENIIHYPPYPKRHVQKTKIFILIYSFYLKLLKNDHEKIGFAVTF